MPVAGRKPKEGEKRNRNPPVHDWTNVVDLPFTGRVPVRLPAKRTLITRDGPERFPLEEMTKRWWETVRSMPHCRLWSKSDWVFALETALVADLLFKGVASAAGELRHRERILGTTVDARRDLRIRYVTRMPDEEPVEERPAGDGVAPVTNIASRRRRLLGVDAS
jgi:hypothetical protein